MTLDEYGNPIENIYVRRVERVNGALQNTVIATLPDGLAVLEIQPRRLPEAAAVRPMTPPCLALEHVSRHFGGLKAVDKVNLVVQPGERHAADRAERRRQDDALQRDQR